MKKNLLSILERPAGVTHRLITTASCEAAVLELLDDEQLHGCEINVLDQQSSNETQQLDDAEEKTRLELARKELEAQTVAPAPTGHDGAIHLVDIDGVVNGDSGSQAAVTALVEQSLQETPPEVTVGILPLSEQIDAETTIPVTDADVDTLADSLESFGIRVLRGRRAVVEHLRFS